VTPASFPGAGALSSAHEWGVRWWRSRHEEPSPRVRRLPRPVISVGNLTVGGTGKTPFVESLARLLSDEGYLTCIISRGYRGKRLEDPLLVSTYTRILHGPSEAGDEPYLLARRLPGVPVVVGCDKHAAGELALSQLKVHVFLLDDGFQTWKLHRDVDIALLDALDPWGGGALLPKGRLREPLDGLKRAHLIGITRGHLADQSQLQSLRADLLTWVPHPQVFFTRTLLTGLRRLPRGVAELSELRARPVLAFAGIGAPGQFFRDLEGTGAILAARREFADHHAYTRADVASLVEEARRVGATALVTTEKDAVRLPALPADAPDAFALRQAVEPETPETLLRWLAAKVPPHGRS
jgi:tetraacyldisaccharide 4'-kinase